MAKYNPNDFVQAIKNKMGDSFSSMKCPFCGKSNFTTTENIAAIFISDDIMHINLGPNIPAGMVICENCGHIDFFALGSLGFIKGEKKDGEQ